MLKIIKMIIFTLFLIFLLLYYMLYTHSGNKFSYSILSFIATQKIGLYTKVKEIHLEDYPHIEAKLIIDKKYNIAIEGYYKKKHFDLHYALTSNAIESEMYKLKSNIELKGTIQGPRKELKITGEGDALDGHVSYSAIKHRHSFDDLHVVAKEINASKLFKLIGEKAIFKGKADITMDFETLSHEKRRGVVHYSVHDRDYQGTDISFTAKVAIKDAIHTFQMRAQTKESTLELLHGTYNKETKQGLADYRVDIKHLSDIKKILKLNVDAPFYSEGVVHYNNKKVTAEGSSKSLGGTLKLFFKDNKLSFHLLNTPLSPLLHAFKVKPLFETTLTGEGIYDIRQKSVVFDANLTDITFNKSKLTDSLHKSFGVNLAKERFTTNRLHLDTIDGKTSITLSLKNKINHIILKDSNIKSSEHAIKSNIDIQLYRYFLKGKLFTRVYQYKKSNDIYINFDGVVQKHYALTLNGIVNQRETSMDYRLSAGRLPSHICTIVDDINLSGHISGPFKHLYIEGEGTALEGNVSFSGTQTKNLFKDIKISMKKIHALKLSTLLGHPELPLGRADIDASFNTLSNKQQEGTIHYILRNSMLFHLPFSLDTNVILKQNRQTFTAKMKLADAKIALTKGEHNTTSNISKAFYTVNVSNLSSLEKLLGYRYRGAFYAVGEVSYNKTYAIHGLSKSFDGFTEFDYTPEHLAIDFDKVSFQEVMHLFPYPSILDAQTTGRVYYDVKKKKLFVNTALKNAKFIHSKITDTIYKKSGIDLLSETFNHSSLKLTHQNKMIVANLILKNDKSHVMLTNANIDTKHKTIHTYFDVHMQKEEFSGKIYGPLSHPNIDLNMQKLVRHEMDKQMDSVMGEGNRKLMDAMPMSTTAKDMASEIGGGFLDMFF